ncbi:hypothetical protein SCOR_13365 [Sulfidibacter corallicola]|uniref:DUF4352 domain-containing protein n=1 Tax=Sulfidibacter corallicola TaxID=2818388 RepID=A0A8A4TFZ7_SULCO|nr:hypothetical protein [Sulfidibacter corallicola]QTD47691.1 hypothetical protein J3U87_19035 [Sulfidibacter corallicola]
MKQFVFSILMILTVAVAPLTAGESASAAEAGTRIEILSSKTGPYTRQAKRAEVLKAIPHLAINDSWRSAVMVRNDTNRTITIEFDLLDIDGRLVNAVIFDGAGNQLTPGSQYRALIAPFEILVFEFDDIVENRANLQAFFYSDEADVGYSLEAIYSSFENGAKNATVGVAVQTPGPNFLINIDQRIDAYSERRKFRGLALTNASTQTCDCVVNLYDDGANGANDQPLSTVTVNSIPSGGKWLGTTYDLFPQIDTLLGNPGLGYGYLEFKCNQNVAALGLAFENGSQISSSVPVDYFEFANKTTQEGRILRNR